MSSKPDLFITADLLGSGGSVDMREVRKNLEPVLAIAGVLAGSFWCVPRCL